MERFASDCLKPELLANSIINVYKIKKDAIPTIFTFTHQPPKRPASQRQGSVPERQDVLDKMITQHKHDVLDETIAQHEETCMEFESKFSEVGCNTDLYFRPDEDVSFSVSIAEVIDSEEYNTENETTDCDASFQTNALETDKESEGEVDENAMAANEAPIFSQKVTALEEMKYVVFFSSLLLLLNNCLICGKPVLI